MDSTGELGIVLRGSQANAVGAALQRWVADSDAWADVIKTYREGKLPGVGISADEGPLDGIREVAVAQDYEGTVPLSENELRAREEGITAFKALAPALANRASEYLFMDTPRHDAVAVQGYYREAHFNYSCDSDDAIGGERWRVGQQRAVMRVLGTVPVRQNKWCVIAAQQVRAFKVTPAVLMKARTLGVTSGNASSANFRAFLDFLKSEASSRSRRRYLSRQRSTRPVGNR